MSKVWPMGCKKIDTEDQLQRIIHDDNYIGQRKIKGVRAVMHVLQDGSLKFTTRGATLDDPETPIDITHRLKHLTRQRFKSLAGLVLDAEMWAPGMDDSEIAGKLNYRSTVEVPREIEPYFFDVINVSRLDLGDKPLAFRLKLLEKLGVLFKNEDVMTWANFVPHVQGAEDKERYLYELLENGEEGMVFKNLGSGYIFTEKKCKKAGYWYKYKRKDTVDAVITGATPPEQFYRDTNTGIYDLGRHTKAWALGWFGSLNFTFTKGDKEFTGSCSGMTDEMREKLSDGNHSVKPEYVGRVIEVEFFERNKYGNCEHPRFLRLREEVEIEG